MGDVAAKCQVCEDAGLRQCIISQTKGVPPAQDARSIVMLRASLALVRLARGEDTPTPGRLMELAKYLRQRAL